MSEKIDIEAYEKIILSYGKMARVRYYGMVTLSTNNTSRIKNINGYGNTNNDAMVDLYNTLYYAVKFVVQEIEDIE